jgi:hypothetical protein
MKVVAKSDRTHNPFGEIYWVSRLRENLTSGSYGEGLETGLRSTLYGHAGGNPGYSQGHSYGLPRQSFTRQLLFRFLKRTLNGIHLIRHDAKGVTIQFYAMLITALLELYLKQQLLDRRDADDPGRQNTPAPAPETTEPPPPAQSYRLRGVDFVSWLNQKVQHYWKIGIHWLTALRDLLACPFDEKAVGILSKL